MRTEAALQAVVICCLAACLTSGARSTAPAPPHGARTSADQALKLSVLPQRPAQPASCFASALQGPEQPSAAAGWPPPGALPRACGAATCTHPARPAHLPSRLGRRLQPLAPQAAEAPAGLPQLAVAALPAIHQPPKDPRRWAPLRRSPAGTGSATASPALVAWSSREQRSGWWSCRAGSQGAGLHQAAAA